MTQELILQDLVFIITSKNQKASILNLDFLKFSGIVPSSWELARQPIYTNNVAQVIFTNGIAITAEPTRVMFAQPIVGKDIESILLPGIARKYAQALPNMESSGVSINLRAYVGLSGSQDIAREYITQNLLSPGAWQSEGELPMRASLNLVYKLKRSPFFLNITEAAIRNDIDDTTTPIVMFGGSFSYEIGGNQGVEKVGLLCQAIENWQADLEDFQNIINNKFIALLPNHASLISDDVEANSLFALSGGAE